MTNAEDLTVNAYLKVRDAISRTITRKTELGSTQARAAAEELLALDYINVDELLKVT